MVDPISLTVSGTALGLALLSVVRGPSSTITQNNGPLSGWSWFSGWSDSTVFIVGTSLCTMTGLVLYFKTKSK